MNAANKILEELKTPEGKEKMERNIKEYIESKKIEDKKIKALMSTPEYINWLISFTQDKNSFTDEDWIYFSEKIDDVSKENVNNLYLFYTGIERYAFSNRIEPNFFDFGEFYKVKYNNFYFKIGIAYGQGSRIFFSKITSKNIKSFINFNSILMEHSKVNSNITKLSNLIRAMYKNGISIEDIMNTVNDTINTLNTSKSKTLVKKK